MDYNGKIVLNDKEYDYIIKDYEMIIIDSKNDILRKNKLDTITGKWIDATAEYDLKLKLLLSYKFSDSNSLKLNVEACLMMHDFEYEKDKSDEVHKITIRSNALDYFYRPNDTYIKEVSEVIGSFQSTEDKRSYSPKKYKISFNKKEYNVFFGVNSYLQVWEKFMFDVFSSMNFYCDEEIQIDELLELVHIAKKFLSFISNSRKVYIDEILINATIGDEQYRCGKFYINQSLNKNIESREVISYENIKNNIPQIFDEIIEDNICFISLFQYEENVINTIDIMNICAAFESQFNITYKNYKDKNLKKVKKDILEAIENMKVNYSKIEDEYYNNIYNCIKFYKDTLKSKLEYALLQFEKLYETTKDPARIGYDFTDDYKEMPNRIKQARNDLDHGNNAKVTYKELRDTQLLRAIVYMMILKKAGVKDEIIMRCIRKFTRLGV